jgi:glycosyltransferase involved in cell wall biosynthesis
VHRHVAGILRSDEQNGANEQNASAMPRILIDARDAAALQIRGWGRYTRELVRALLAGAGADLDILATIGSGAAPEVAFEQVWLPLLARRRQAAVLHAPNCFLPVVRPCPGVVTIHDLAFEEWPGDFPRTTAAKFRMITRLAARSAERIICPSRFTADDVCRRYGVDVAKVRVIPEAAALGPVGVSAETSAANGPFVLAVGDLRAKKNLGALVRAFAELRAADGIPHRLVMAGVDAGEGPQLARLAGGAPLELTGYVDDARLDALIRGADLLVHPSLYEGFGLVVVEAMVRGIPVLAARATALPETGGDAARYFDPSDPGDLRRQLAVLLGDSGLRERLAALGRERAATFSWERTARETAAVYRELL